MAYATGTINSATPAVSLMTVIDTQLLAVGWTFVETQTNATITVNVYKSPGVSNSFGSDFYLAVGRSSNTDTFIKFGIAEGYDTGTHSASKYADDAAAVPQADYSRSGTSVATSWYVIAASCALQFEVSALFTYYINVTVDRLIISNSHTTIANSQGVYAGLFDPLLPNEPFPLVLLVWPQSLATIGVTCVTTRTALLGAATASGTWWNGGSTNTVPITVAGSPSLMNCWGPVGTTASSNLNNDPYNTTQQAVARPVLWMNAPSSVYRARGILKGLVYCVAGTAHADTLAVTYNGVVTNYIRGYSANPGTGVPCMWMPVV